MNNIHLYLALLLGTYLEGETAVLTASFAAARGFMSFPLVIIFSFFGTLFTDWFHFFVGRFQGRKLINRSPQLKNRLDKISRRIEQNPMFILLIYRFLYGLRIIFPIAIGMSKVKTSHFLFLSSLSTTIWVSIFTFMGFNFGEYMGKHFKQIEQYEKQIILILFILVIAVALLLTYLKNRKN